MSGFSLDKLLEPDTLMTVVRVALLIGAGIPAVLWLGQKLRQTMTRRMSAQHGLIAGKIVMWGGVSLILITVLTELKFSLAPFLGAAGVVGIAIGFASQTSVSNIISGLFLITEKPFQVGDILRIDDKLGIVLSIDMLSVKLRTFDNRMMRIPNESLIKTNFTNMTRFPIIRIDMNVGVAYREDIGRVKDILLDLAHKNPNVLEEPEPLVIFTNFNSSSVDMLFAIWATKENFLVVRNAMYEDIMRRFREEDIEIPFPHLSFYTGSETKPLPIQLVGDSAALEKAMDSAEAENAENSELNKSKPDVQ